MDNSKLIAALGDLKAKRSAIDSAIVALEAALETLGPSHERSEVMVQRRSSGRSNLDIAMEVLSSVENMHIEALAEKVSAMAGHPVSRATLDGGISREIRENNGSSRFDRVSPGVYRLRRQTAGPMA